MVRQCQTSVQSSKSLPKFLFELLGRTECLSAQWTFDILLPGGHLMIEPHLHAFDMNVVAAAMSGGRNGDGQT